MDALTSNLSAIAQWAYPSPSKRAYLDLLNLNLGLFFLPLLLHTISIHLLLRHHKSPFANALRAGVLLPLNIIFSIRAGLGCILPSLSLGPNPSAKEGGVSYFMYTVGGERTEGGFQHFHVAMGVYSAYSIMRALEWGLASRPPRLSPALLDLVRQQRAREQGVATHNKTGNGKTTKNGDVDVPPTFLPRYIPGTTRRLEYDLLSNMRGIGWEWGIPYLPSHPPILHPTPHSSEAKSLQTRRGEMIASRFKYGLLFFLLSDIVDSILKEQAIFGPRANVGGPVSLGGVATEAIRYEEQPIYLQWALTLLAGLIIPISMNGTFNLLSALSLLPAHLFPHSEWVWQRSYGDPSSWAAPLFQFPHAPKDLRTLWGRDWHALFRRPFLCVAYQPVNETLKAVGLGVSVGEKDHGTNGKKSHQNGNGNGEKKVSEGIWRGTPGKMVRRALSVLSVFLVSGLMHEAGQLALARTPAERDPWRFFGRGEPILVYYPPSSMGALRLAYVDTGGRAVLFFLMQGVGCVFEDAVERMFASKRKGRTGVSKVAVRLLTWCWVAVWIFGWGHYVGKAWFRMGIAQGVISFRATGALAHIIMQNLSRA
ncbi:hypothetical protein CF326_g2882 [Tilletia indica]|nr:hypothetical protein CF326_g2882 [Tilletia indica]